MHIRILLLPQDSHIHSNNHQTAQKYHIALQRAFSKGRRDAEPQEPFELLYSVVYVDLRLCRLIIIATRDE